jgi:glycolate oxidase FAD binding subunit
MTMSDVAPLLDELTAIVGEPFVRTTPQTEAYRVDEHVPWAVVSPGSVEEVAAVLALAHRAEMAVVPWGGGTTMGLGQPLERLDLVLCLHRLNHVVEHEPADLTATAEAGITLTDLQNQLSSRGQWWPVDPPLPDSATLGGVLATNSSGPKRFLYGTARDLVIGVKVVHADGVSSKAGGKVAKNVTGYDMMKLYIGSLGTLAVIVEATLKLRPFPPVQQLVWATFPTPATAWRAAQQLLTSPLLPNAVELVNPNVAAYLQQNVAGPDRAQGWALVVGFDGVEPAVARQVRELHAICQAADMTAWWTDLDDGRLWHAIQARFRPQSGERQERLVIRVGTVRTQALPVLAALTHGGAPSGDAVELTARLGNGLIYANAPCPHDRAGRESLIKAMADIRAQVMARRGYLVVESAPVPFKAQFDSWGDLGPQVEVMSALKREFDPRRVLNPGRFFSGL